MKIVMDSDCLVKLTKAGAKEAIVQSMDVYIPYLVKKETVDEVVGRGFHDASVIEENISNKALHVTKHSGRVSVAGLGIKGEDEVLSLYHEGGYDAIASDDRRFLRKLEASAIPYLTPTACVAYIYKSGRVGKGVALDLLEGLKPFVSSEEYQMARFYMEEKE